ncbi:MAG: dihydrodipicolinate synthase family protein [Candidatus Margulisiibacteriota bacterium]
MDTPLPLIPPRRVEGLLVRENVVATVTPFIESATQLQADEEAVAKLCGHILKLGENALFVAGTTGEFAYMTDKLRIETVTAFARASKGRFRIIANASGDSPEATLKNIGSMAGLKEVSAIVIAPLHYLRMNEEIPQHMEQVLSLMEAIEKPLLLYNLPKIHLDTSLNIDPSIVKVFRNSIAGLKDSSCDLELLGEYAKQIETGTGDEGNITGALRKGAAFSVNSIGNILPYPQRIFNSSSIVEMEKWQKAINDVRLPLTANRRSATAATKYWLSLKGICSSRMADRGKELTQEEKISVEEVFNRLRKET